MYLTTKSGRKILGALAPLSAISQSAENRAVGEGAKGDWRENKRRLHRRGQGLRRPERSEG